MNAVPAATATVPPPPPYPRDHRLAGSSSHDTLVPLAPAVAAGSLEKTADAAATLIPVGLEYASDSDVSDSETAPWAVLGSVVLLWIASVMYLVLSFAPAAAPTPQAGPAAGSA
ncbi:hypothetical protein H9P43_000219 [Blastocladiella emersonii ATCC 22665]|nr:hypothetical protein H9P43_000219 [Blastocladiella emersonii ATCC 22665]